MSELFGEEFLETIKETVVEVRDCTIPIKICIIIERSCMRGTNCTIEDIFNKYGYPFKSSLQNLPNVIK